MNLIYDQNFNYQEHKLSIINELRKIQDRINQENSVYYNYLKEELENELQYTNQIINEYYYL
ncbi:MAG: hypothetical protein WD512_09400 [Candidatus Paceibacterota bacterium]